MLCSVVANGRLVTFKASRRRGLKLGVIGRLLSDAVKIGAWVALLATWLLIRVS
jgi:hypothetical protein